ncbi:MAG: hypothetical protein ACI841_001150 [Planctomycetota bacterium]|jgi:hypothetical protein
MLSSSHEISKRSGSTLEQGRSARHPRPIRLPLENQHDPFNTIDVSLH